MKKKNFMKWMNFIKTKFKILENCKKKNKKFFIKKKKKWKTIYKKSNKKTKT